MQFNEQISRRNRGFDVPELIAPISLGAPHCGGGKCARQWRAMSMPRQNHTPSCPRM